MAHHNHLSHLNQSSAAASGSGTSGFLGLGLAGDADSFGGLSFIGFLRAFADADKVFFAELEELNNSDAEGGALLLQDGDQLTVITAATGVEAGQVHPQHIHGFENGSDARVPTLVQDHDRDGFIELAEGLDTYGPVLLDLTAPPGSGLAGFPEPSGNSFIFAQKYDLSDPANGQFATLLDEAPLENREIVLHGLTTLEGHGAATDGEVNGDPGYKAVLPIAAGEIKASGSQEALAGFVDTLDGFDSSHHAHMADADGTASGDGENAVHDDTSAHGTNSADAPTSTAAVGDDGHDENCGPDCDDKESSAGGENTASTEVFGQLTFAGFLRAVVDADKVFFAELEELNNSDAEGGALLLLDGSKLTVITAATGVEAGQAHAQHIHGLLDGGDARVPTLAQDDDRDGFIELVEGLDTYGPVLLNLASHPGPVASGFPMPSGDSFIFAQTYDLSDPASGDMAHLLLDAPLDNREIVLHGMTTLEGHGAGRNGQEPQGEVDGEGGYKAVLPIAAGEIREAASFQEALTAFVDTLDEFETGSQTAMNEWMLAA